MKIAAAVIFALIGYFIWRFVFKGDALVLVGSKSVQRVSASLSHVTPNQKITIEVKNPSTTEQIITAISVPRSVVVHLKLSPPSGFDEMPLPLSQSETSNNDMADFVEQYNKETIRWQGNLPLKPQSALTIEIPAKLTEPLAGTLQFQYERKIGLGGSISFFNVKLDERVENRVPDTP